MPKLKKQSYDQRKKKKVVAIEKLRHEKQQLFSSENKSSLLDCVNQQSTDTLDNAK